MKPALVLSGPVADTLLILLALLVLGSASHGALQTRDQFTQLQQALIRPHARPALRQSGPDTTAAQQFRQLRQHQALQPAHRSIWQPGLATMAGPHFVLLKAELGPTQAADARGQWRRYITPAELIFTLTDERGLDELQAQIHALPGLARWQSCELLRADAEGISAQCTLLWSGFGPAEAA